MSSVISKSYFLMRLQDSHLFFKYWLIKQKSLFAKIDIKYSGMMPYILFPFCTSSCSFFFYLGYLSSHSFPGDWVWLWTCWQLARVHLAPGNQSSKPGSIPKDQILDWLPTWHQRLTDDPVLQWAKNIWGSAHTLLARTTTQTLKCTNTLTPKYSVITQSETNTYNCVWSLDMRMHVSKTEAMSVMWLNLSSTGTLISI